MILRSVLIAGPCHRLLLSAVLVVHAAGCVILQPVGDLTNLPSQMREGSTRIAVGTQDGSIYDFPPHQYSLTEDTTAAVIRLSGWGEKRGAMGAMERGYFDIPSSRIRTIETEKIHAVRTMLAAGLMLAAGVAVYLGIVSISTDDVAQHRPGEYDLF